MQTFFISILKGGLYQASIVIHIKGLHFVHRFNEADQASGKRDITVYPVKAYDISEVEHKIDMDKK